MNNIHSILTRKGLYRRDVADRIGIPLQMMHNYCNEQARIPFDVLVCIAKMLGVGVEDLGSVKVGSPKYANASAGERKKFIDMAKGLGLDTNDLGYGDADRLGMSEDAKAIDSRIEKLREDIADIRSRIDSITYRHPDFTGLVSSLNSKRIKLCALERDRDKYYSTPDENFDD